ncbi:MAG: alpha/beta fold hydrolase [Rubrivivax sp.]|nr:alpha/beta fold hydrolase [Rubrivivax sp.]
MAWLAALLLVTAGWLWTPDLAQDDLEARYARGPGDFVQVDGLRLHLRDSGPRDAPAVILLHGFGASLHTWEPWAQALSPHYRVIRYDLPGSGLTGPDPGADYSDTRNLHVLLSLMDHLGLQRATLVGHSMGGRLAWRMAAANPQRVAGLVLVAPDGFASPGFEYGKPPEVPAVLQLMRVVLPRALLRMNLAPAYAKPELLSDDTVARYHDLLRAPGARQAMLQRMGQIVLHDPAPLLAHIQAPTLLMWGELDAMIPVANAQDYLRALPAVTGARLVSLPGVGHLPQEEAPAAGLPALLAFLQSLPTAP